MMSILKALINAVVSVFLIIASLFDALFCIPAVQSGYYQTVDAEGEIEKIYTQPGEYNVSSETYDSGKETYKKYKVWFPEEMKTTDAKYPVVVMVNGTGVPYRKYEAVFEHLASWGFIVIGNDDENPWDGASSSEALTFLLDMNDNESGVFYRKIDESNIGVAGHSQGGVGAVNAATNFDNSVKFTSVYSASITHIELAKSLQWQYDITKISAPYFMVAGTGSVDAETISPLITMNESFDCIESGAAVVMARRKNTDHGEMLANADGYMTAWFCYTLKNDETAAKAFCGASPEIALSTNNWQDVRIKNMK